MSNSSSYLPSQPQLSSINHIKKLERQIAEHAAHRSASENDTMLAHGRQSVDSFCEIEDLKERVTELEAALKAAEAKVATLEKEVDEHEKAAAAAGREAYGSQRIVLSLDTP